MIIPPYPFTLEDPADVPLADAWYAGHSCSSHAGFALWMAGRPVRATTCEALTTLRCTWCFLAHLRSLSCQQRAPWMMLQPSCMSRPRHQYCSWPPTTMCWVECPYFPCSLMATPLPVSHDTTPSAPSQHTICAISEPALSSMGPPMPPHLTAGEEATLSR